MTRTPPEPPGQVVQTIRCPGCHGRGYTGGYYDERFDGAPDWVPRSWCAECNGTGGAAQRVVPVGLEPFPKARD